MTDQSVFLIKDVFFREPGTPSVTDSVTYNYLEWIEMGGVITTGVSCMAFTKVTFMIRKTGTKQTRDNYPSLLSYIIITGMIIYLSFSWLIYLSRGNEHTLPMVIDYYGIEDKYFMVTIVTY